jgi:uroporphyrin-III C-methyltransferase
VLDAHPDGHVRSGTVFLVGAGPGDPGLLTVRALELIQRATIVLHDHLVSAAILARCHPRARLISVGKVGHGSRTEQRAIERQLIAHGRDGRNVVVRLKGGDPLLFGRGAEEASALRAAGIRFEIVPGVSSALAAPAYAGIPVTRRGVASSVAIVAGQCAHPDGPPLQIPLADTIVVLMGVTNARAIRDRVIAAGRSAETPVAVIEWGTCPEQRVAVATLATLPDLIEQSGLMAPAVIVIGETVRSRPALAWFTAPAALDRIASVVP